MCFVNTCVVRCMYIAGLKFLKKYGAYINNKLKHKNFKHKIKKLVF